MEWLKGLDPVTLISLIQLVCICIAMFLLVLRVNQTLIMLLLLSAFSFCSVSLLFSNDFRLPEVTISEPKSERTWKDAAASSWHSVKCAKWWSKYTCNPDE